MNFRGWPKCMTCLDVVDDVVSEPLSDGGVRVVAVCHGAREAVELSAAFFRSLPRETEAYFTEAFIPPEKSS